MIGRSNRRQHRGRVADLSGRAAEDAVERHYRDLGLAVADRRWRGQAGELDIVAEDGDGIVVIEVKRARDHDRAAQSLSGHQIRRLCDAASEYIGRLPFGQLTSVRFDLALVDRIGRVRVIENAFGA